MDLAAVLDQVAARAKSIGGLRAHARMPGSISPPAAFPWPDSITFDQTYGRGVDRIAAELVLCVGRPTDATALDRLLPYCAGTGPRSVKAALESGRYTAMDDVQVPACRFDVITIGGTDYLAALFDLIAVGPGGVA